VQPSATSSPASPPAMVGQRVGMYKDIESRKTIKGGERREEGWEEDIFANGGVFYVGGKLLLEEG